MENLLLITSSSLIGLYGILNAFAGWSQSKQDKIPAWSASLMLVSGLFILASGAMLFWKLPLTIPVLVIGLLAIHGLTIRNGLYLYGKINIQHHIFRFVISIILLGLALISLQ